MNILFGRRRSPAEMLRENQRALQRAINGIDRERVKLEAQEKKLVADIKRSARAGQMGAVKIMAKDIARTRKQVEKFFQMRAQLQAVSVRIQSLQGSQAMSDAMVGVTKTLKTMNRNFNLPQITKIMQDFEKESMMMDIKEEMMGDAIDDAMDQEGDIEAEEDEIVQKVLDEIGIQTKQSLADAPTTSVPNLVNADMATASLSRVALADGPADPAPKTNGNSVPSSGPAFTDRPQQQSSSHQNAIPPQVPPTTQAAKDANDEDAELMARFNKLRK